MGVKWFCSGVVEDCAHREVTLDCIGMCGTERVCAVVCDCTGIY
jgi:hypothetical protein